MESPTETIRKARNNARFMPAISFESFGTDDAKPASETPPPTPVSRHGTYTSLMQRHDRVRTQHLRGQRNADGA